MPALPCVYRRPSGIYAVRISVPQRHRLVIGRGEIHASTGLKEPGPAKIIALRIQIAWRERFMALDEERLKTANPILLGGGMIPIDVAAEEMGMSHRAFLCELLNEKVQLFLVSDTWAGDLIPDPVDRHLQQLVSARKDWKISSSSGFLDTRFLRVGRPDRTLGRLLRTGSSSEEQFILCSNQAFRLKQPMEFKAADFFLEKGVAERIRAGVAKLALPKIAETSPTPVPVPQQPAFTDPISIRYGQKKFSELFSLFQADRQWGKEQEKRMRTEAGLFRDLMLDPKLCEIDKEMVHAYARRLAELPSDIYQSRRKLGRQASLEDLVSYAQRNKLPTKGEDTIKGHVSRLSEILGYAVKNGMMHVNPAADFRRSRGRNRMRRTQDERQSFTSAELSKIFAQAWFAKGRGEFSENGATNWRPHYYWMPLLGLLTGARLNELAQLYVSDFRQTPSGAWYVDFNLDKPDKKDVDGAEVATKSLKTPNAIRQVPLHAKLIELGLLDYLAELERAKFVRLFPELRADPIKGYGKPAGSWFNQRLLGDALKIPRDGKKTFHSLRHSFITSLERTDVPERVMAQLAGHERGSTQSAIRYAKDRAADDLQSVVNQIDHDFLANLESFDCKAGIDAIRVAQRRKAAMAGARKR